MTRLKSLKGFTLIELIVVVIIIGVLAAIAAVAYNQFVAQARKTAAVANAKQVVTAASAYGQQNDLNAAEAIVVDKATLGIEGSVTIKGTETSGAVTPGALSYGTPAVSVTEAVRVVTDSKHDCLLDVSGELPVLVMASCK